MLKYIYVYVYVSNKYPLPNFFKKFSSTLLYVFCFRIPASDSMQSSLKARERAGLTEYYGQPEKRICRKRFRTQTNRASLGLRISQTTEPPSSSLHHQ